MDAHSWPVTARDVAVAAPTRLVDFAGTHGRALNRFAYLLSGDRGRAEDLVQDAYLSLYRRFGDELPVAAPVTYARRVIANAYISHGRRRRPPETLLFDLPDVAGPAEDGSERDAMWRLLDGLPERQRAVLVLRYYVDLTDADIAEVLDCRQGTVRSLAARAFAALRPRFESEETR